jgi:hypothetical protein
MNTGTSDPLAVPPVAPDGALEAASVQRRVRDRRVILVSGVFAVLVMAAVVTFGWQASRLGLAGDESGAGGPGGPGGRAGAPWLPPDDDECPTDSEHPPRMVFDLPPSGLHFGEVKQGLVLEKDIVFRNEGSGPLCIRRVDSGCGCIKAKLLEDVRRYEPGESGRIHVLLDTKGREGQQKKTITIYTNAVDVPLQRFVVRAVVNQGLRYSPAMLRYGQVTVGRPAEARLSLRAPKSDGDWAITSVQGTRPVNGEISSYTFRTEEVADAQDRVIHLFVTHPGLEKAGQGFTDTLVVRTSHPNRAEFTVKATLMAVDPITPSPHRAVLGFVPGKIPARVRLMRGDEDVAFSVVGQHFELTDGTRLEDGESGFVAEALKEQGEWWMVVKYDGRERTSGPLRAVLVVETDHERQPEIRIGCFANVK